jgi:3-oxoacyl-[acyl-carrier protein] reductase
LAEEGANVGVVARTRVQCEAVATEIGECGLALPADVSDAGACADVVEKFIARFESLSVLVNAAGISPVRQRAEAHDVDAFRSILEINLLGTFTMMRAAAPTLLANGGSVVNIASVLGVLSSPRLAGYGASKAGIIQLTRTMAREWADRGIRVNVVCPGYTDTSLTEAMLKVGHLRKEVLEAIPLGRLATFEEIVAPVIFLASEAASYITGAVILVDGGMAA